MVVPNYIPAPIEVPGNVTEAPYRIRIGFIRRVAVLHLVSVALIGAIALLPLPSVPIAGGLLQVGAILLVLSLVRIGKRATRFEAVLSSATLPLLLLTLAVVARTAALSGFPLWGILVGVGCSTLYALLCGRDFSFVGQYLLSLIVSSVGLAMAALGLRYAPQTAAFLLAANGLYLFYLVYDSASLLARRRLGEEIAAVVDLYRDVFNFLGYLVRVARHWRKHRIWAR